MSLVEGLGWAVEKDVPINLGEPWPRPVPEKTGVLLAFKAADSGSIRSLRRHSRGLQVSAHPVVVVRFLYRSLV
jgi:hypothetical protein